MKTGVAQHPCMCGRFRACVVIRRHLANVKWPPFRIDKSIIDHIPHSEMRLIIVSRVALICFVVAVLLSSVSEHVILRASPPNQAQQFQHKFTNKYKNKLGLSWFLHKWKFKVICWAFLDCRLQQWPVVFHCFFVFVFLFVSHLCYLTLSLIC